MHPKAARLIEYGQRAQEARNADDVPRAQLIEWQASILLQDASREGWLDEALKALDIGVAAALMPQQREWIRNPGPRFVPRELEDTPRELAKWIIENKSPTEFASGQSRIWRDLGLGRMPQGGDWLLTGPGSEEKFIKTLKLHGYATCGLSLSPADEAWPYGSGRTTLCPFAGLCAAVCLVMSGNYAAGKKRTGRNLLARMHGNDKVAARVRKSLWLLLEPETFWTRLDREVEKFVRWCRGKGYGPAMRPNILSDLPDFGLKCQERYSNWGLRVYDYTKWPPFTWIGHPEYHRTYSVSERSIVSGHNHIQSAIEKGAGVAVVYEINAKKKVKVKGLAEKQLQPLPPSGSFYGLPMVDGDISDARFLDATPCCVGLRGKGGQGKVDAGADFMVAPITWPVGSIPTGHGQYSQHGVQQSMRTAAALEREKLRRRRLAPPADPLEVPDFSRRMKPLRRNPAAASCTCAPVPRLIGAGSLNDNDDTRFRAPRRRS